MSHAAQQPVSVPAPQPWWRFGMVWLVLAGPAVVVVAGVVTAWIAMNGADTLVSTDYYRRGIESNKTLLPAVQGRNHAATPVPAGGAGLPAAQPSSQPAAQ